MEISLPSDLSEFVRTQVEIGAYPSEVALVVEAVRLLKVHAPPAPANGQGVTVHRPIWDVLEAIGAEVPGEEWDKLPSDLSTQHDHYLYGSPKRPE